MAVTVYMFGQIQLLWNYLMDQMDGFVLFWMENWRPCTPVAVRKMEVIVQVGLNNHMLWTNYPFGY